MAYEEFKIGDRVIIHPDNGYPEWEGITGVISDLADRGYIRVELDSRPRQGVHGFLRTRSSWLRPLKPLSPLEEQIAAYVKAEMAQL